MIELLGDLNNIVAAAAACALGRMGRTESRPTLVHLLLQAPSIEVIDAACMVADDDCLVLLGRIGRTRPDLTDAVLATLDNSDAPRAAHIADAVRRARR